MSADSIRPPATEESLVLRAGHVADAAGVNRETLRYYERRGLLPQPSRSPGGHRLYSAHAVTVLRVIKAAQRLGFTLDEVADLLRMGRHRHRTGPDAGLQAHARVKLAQIEDRIADLETIRENLRTALDAGCDDLTVCASAECCPLPFVGLATHQATTAGGVAGPC
jgi:DNA-binding transcriptional MerR regulator